MSAKNIFSAAALALIFNICFAQQKMRGLTFFPADSTIQPASASVIVYAGPSFNDKANKLIEVLNKKGIAVAKLLPGNATPLKAFEFLKMNAFSHKVTTPKIGILILGRLNKAQLIPDSLIFAGIIDPLSVDKAEIPASVPLFIDETGHNKEVMNSYTRLFKKNNLTDLHLHQHIVADSVQTSEFIDWLGTLGLLEPISHEKTSAQKKQQDWNNFMKMIDDRLHNDWAWLKRYEADNNKMPAPSPGEKRVIFLGNSITEGWINQDPEFFKSHNYINRGIGGQTTPQMLVRFREDVVNLRPKVVIILAGTNDIAQNTGPSRLENVAGNIISMAEIAKTNGIKVILCSVLPAIRFPWHPGIDPVPQIIKLNAMLKDYAERNKLEYVDYYSAVADEKQGFKKDLAIDGVVHPNLAGYKIMEPLAVSAIEKALSAK
jgi:lysophospholipase L1-like esterase